MSFTMLCEVSGVLDGGQAREAMDRLVFAKNRRFNLTRSV